MKHKYTCDKQKKRQRNKMKVCAWGSERENEPEWE